MPFNPQIIYSVIVRGADVILTEYSSASGNFIALSRQIISKFQGTNIKRSYQMDQYEFHILTENGFAFLIMSEKGFPMRIAFAFLEEIKNTFFAQYTQQVREQALAYGLNSQFSKVQKQKMEYYNSPDVDKLLILKKNLEETKEIMLENLDKLIERGQKIELVVQKTSVMVNISTDMKYTAKQLRRDMWWRNKKMILIITLIVLLAIYFLLVICCGGFAMKGCF